MIGGRSRVGRRRRSSRQLRILMACLAFLAILPPLFFHIRIRRIQLAKCAWLLQPPLVCAHGGDSSVAPSNTLAAYASALNSKVDCIEIDVSRSSDGVLFALHDR
ncbi:Glycerophosphodiester phosphodiesterase gdpd4 [Stylosanthes scabra]|uniref:glycerophosphodiester phosphodiesterase n=1 Tax=Stylosanthes scabra TaxID=79078 RepID=A0ABU6Y3T0_9FABA|nr:Glycerophosphodiester phosphodiesterase gdpd4 [Stylosanthes scabra]